VSPAPAPSTAPSSAAGISTSREDYLKRLYVLQQRRPGAVPMGKLAESVGVTPASVTGMIKTLVDQGLVDHEPYTGATLTAEGERLALHVLRRHRLIELFLVETLGIDWSAVHAEAEALEHVISDFLLDRIDEFLGRPTVDPHGDPIPGPTGKLEAVHVDPLSRCESGSRVRIVRVTDQEAPFLQYVDRIGLRPGAMLRVQAVDPHSQTIEVKPRGGDPVTLALTAAAKLMVEPL